MIRAILIALGLLHPQPHPTLGPAAPEFNEARRTTETVMERRRPTSRWVMPVDDILWRDT